MLHLYILAMSQNPEKRNKDSKEVAEGNIEQPVPLDKEDPTEPVKVRGAGQRKGIEGVEGTSNSSSATLWLFQITIIMSKTEDNNRMYCILHA